MTGLNETIFIYYGYQLVELNFKKNSELWENVREKNLKIESFTKVY